MLKIVQILIKNTSTLDFSLPILIELKNRGHEIIIIDLCRKKNSLSKLYLDLMNEYDIKYLSRECLFSAKFRYILKIFDKIEHYIKPIRLNEILSEDKKVVPFIKFFSKNFLTILFHTLREIFYKVSKLQKYPINQLSNY